LVELKLAVDGIVLTHGRESRVPSAGNASLSRSYLRATCPLRSISSCAAAPANLSISLRHKPLDLKSDPTRPLLARRIDLETVPIVTASIILERHPLHRVHPYIR
jgi:hypothetical protein